MAPAVRAWIAAIVLASGAAALQAQAGSGQQPQQQPTFRTGIDISRVTVRVLDLKRQPVRGLTEKDFTVLVNGVAQPIITVAAIDEEGPVTPTAPWMRDVAPDVATNTLEDPRLIVIIMDDAAADGQIVGRTGPFALKQFRLIVTAIINELGPNDLATVVFTGDNRTPQDFTTDRRRLLDVLDRFHPTGVGPLATRYSRNVLESAIELLRGVPERRSVIFFVGRVDFKADQFMLPRELRPQPGADGTARPAPPLPAGFPTVFTVDTTGFNGAVWPNDQRDDTITAATGGQRIAFTNTPALEIPKVFREMSLRYTIGYQSTEPLADGRFRRVQVRVNRPDVIIEPRDQDHFAPKAAELAAAAKLERSTRPTTLAMSGIIPLADEPLRLVVAPLAATASARGGRTQATVAVALGVEMPPDFGRFGDTFELETRVFDAEGRKQIVADRQAHVLKPRGGQDRSGYDLLSTLALKPGRYNIRVSMHSNVRERAGSVYTDFVVPDFAKEALSLSGAVVSIDGRGVNAIPPGEFHGVLPSVPATTRVFDAKDRVNVFLRVYAGGNKPPAPVAMSAGIRDTGNAVVFSQEQTVTPAGEAVPRSADYSLMLPLERLKAGEYVLTIAATPATGAALERNIRFRVN